MHEVEGDGRACREPKREVQRGKLQQRWHLVDDTGREHLAVTGRGSVSTGGRNLRFTPEPAFAAVRPLGTPGTEYQVVAWLLSFLEPFCRSEVRMHMPRGLSIALRCISRFWVHCMLLQLQPSMCSCLTVHVDCVHSASSSVTGHCMQLGSMIDYEHGAHERHR